MTEAATAVAEKKGTLDGIEVLKPENTIEKTRKYFASIKPILYDAAETDPEKKRALSLQIGIGPVTFSSETFKWEGAGENARQVFRDGAVCELTDAQVKEIRERLRFRYYRFERSARGQVTGFTDVDVSDCGGIDEKTRLPVDPKRLAGRLRGDEKPLKDLLILEPINEDPTGRVLTIEDAKALLAQLEAEASRTLEDDAATFETGRGGKKAPKGVGSRATLDELSTTRGGKSAGSAGLLG